MFCCCSQMGKLDRDVNFLDEGRLIHVTLGRMQRHMSPLPLKQVYQQTQFISHSRVGILHNHLYNDLSRQQKLSYRSVYPSVQKTKHPMIQQCTPQFYLAVLGYPQRRAYERSSGLFLTIK